MTFTQSVQHRWLAMSALLVCSFVVLMDVTIVNIAMPTIVRAMGASVSQIIWLSSIYSLSFAVPMLVAARLGDRYGPKRLFVCGLLLFMVGSVASGTAGAMPALIIGRAVQGLGAAAMTPQGLTFVTRLFAQGERGLAFGLSGAIGGIATVSAPVLGGALVQTLGWRWVFLINLPVAIVALVLAVIHLPNWRPQGRPQFDPAGVILLCSALLAITFGVQQGARYDWGRISGPITIPMIIIAGGVLLCAFVVWQRANPGEPLLDLRLFRHRNYSLSNIVNPGLGFVMSGLWIPLAIYIQLVLGLSPLIAGLVTAPSPVASGIIAPLAGRLSDRWNSRRIIVAGLTLFAIGIAILVLQAHPNASPWSLMPALALIGIGSGATFPALTDVAMTGIPDRLIGAAAGAFQTFQQLGSALGAAIVSAILQVRLATEYSQQAILEASSLPHAVHAAFIDAIARASGAGTELDAPAHLSPPADLPDTIAAEFRSAGARVFQVGFSNAMQSTLLLTVCVLAVAIGAALAMRPTSQTPHQQNSANPADSAPDDGQPENPVGG